MYVWACKGAYDIIFIVQQYTFIAFKNDSVEIQPNHHCRKCCIFIQMMNMVCIETINKKSFGIT